METARLFQNGKSQAIRLPKAFRFAGDRVYIKRVDNAVVILPFDDPWRPMLDSLDKFSDDFMEAREQPAQTPREQPFA